MLELVTAAIKSTIEIITAVDAASKDRRATEYRSKRDILVRALRELYFTPSGTRSLLKSLAQGERPAQEDIKAILSEFNDAEWSVGREIENLDFDLLINSKSITLEAAEQLHELRYGKSQLRSRLQGALNEPLTFGQPIDPGEAQALLEEVEALNRRISTLERSLNYRAEGT